MNDREENMSYNGFIYSWTGNPYDKWEFIENTPEAKASAIQKGADRFSTLAFESEPTEENPYPKRYGDLFIDFDSKNNIYAAIREMYDFCTYLYCDFGIDPNMFEFWLSGGKGCHLKISSTIFLEKKEAHTFP